MPVLLWKPQLARRLFRVARSFFYLCLLRFLRRRWFHLLAQLVLLVMPSGDGGDDDFFDLAIELSDDGHFCAVPFKSSELTLPDTARLRLYSPESYQERVYGHA